LVVNTTILGTDPFPRGIVPVGIVRKDGLAPVPAIDHVVSQATFESITTMSHDQTQPRVLAVALSSRGFGFAVMDGQNALIAWGNKTAYGDKNAKSIAKLERLVNFYQPGVLVLQDAAAQGSRREALNRRIVICGLQFINIRL